ncbi:hypothetical protein V6N11_060128 [Hibiscus sabdariffa]|uniref:Uncharacterized protein n=1 Tax=Hibiscus sabdariffa TaxID=183260 RepID=A0ABR2P328_9ROSI
MVSLQGYEMPPDSLELKFQEHEVASTQFVLVSPRLLRCINPTHGYHSKGVEASVLLRPKVPGAKRLLHSIRICFYKSVEMP